ncbi:patatin-like phospholipase family protein [Microbulbifer sp. ANSA001]|uniref:patatin-like phospholipase family protein n=1 Tax=Microbulbifer sp. ANSA001 TaxID=3243358 RepID=UPI0040425E8E
MRTRYLLLTITLLAFAFIGTVYFYNNQLAESIKFNATPVSDEPIVSNKGLEDKDTIKILIIDGGGIRGLIPLYVLQYIEEKLGKPTSEIFDVFSGVSTGAIIATGLNMPHQKDYMFKDEEAELHSKSEKIIDIYKSESEYLFSSPWYHKILTVNGFLSPRFLGDRLHEVMQKHYSSELNFRELNNYVIIPSLDIHTGKLHLFKNRGEDSSELPTDTLYQLVTAAAAAETLFPPVDFMSHNDDVKHRYYSDAGISANNPASIILREIIKEFPGKKYYVLVLGAGTSPLETMEKNYRELKNWGRLNWMQDAISNVQRSMDDQQIYTLDIAKSLAPEGQIEFNYLNVEIIDPFVDPFDYKSIDKLKILSERLINDNKEEICHVLKHLGGET